MAYGCTKNGGSHAWGPWDPPERRESVREFVDRSAMVGESPESEPERASSGLPPWWVKRCSNTHPRTGERCGAEEWIRSVRRPNRGFGLHKLNGRIVG